MISKFVLLLAAVIAAVANDYQSASTVPTQYIYQDGKTLRLPINDTATEELLEKWISQALSGLMAAVASSRLDQMDEDDREEVHRCAKRAATVPEHAKCVVKVLDKTKRIKKASIVKKKTAIHVKRSSKGITKSRRIEHEKKAQLQEWIGGFRMARAKREILNRSNYNITTEGDDTLFARLARKMTKTIRAFKEKPGAESWRSAVQRIKKVNAKARVAIQRRKELKRRFKQMIENTPDGFQDPRKPLFMKQMAIQDEEVRRQKKIAKRKRDEVRIPLRLLRESIKMIMTASGKNMTNFDKKTIKLISPRFLSLVPDQNDDDLINILSPSVLSLHQEGGEIEKAMSLQHMLKHMPSRDQEAWLDFIVEASGVTDAVDKAEKSLNKLHEQELFNKDGVPLYLTKKNATEILGDTEKRKIETFEKLDKSYTAEQKDDLERDGYAFLNSKQLRIIYGPDSPYNKSDSLELFLKFRRMRDDPQHLLEHDIRTLAEAKKFQVRRKQLVLSPIVLTWLTFQSQALSQAIVLSPLVLSPITLSPAVLGPLILSPFVFVPIVLSPRVLGPLVLNPTIFSPIVLSPLVLHPLILSPGVSNPLVLSPLVLSPLILSPQVLTPLILSPMVLNPLILNPMAGSPLVLSPFVLSPIIYSPQIYSAVILSPYALSPLLESQLVNTEVILSPSWLS